MTNKIHSLPRANGRGFTSDFLGDVCSLRQIILEKEAIVENAAGTRPVFVF